MLNGERCIRKKFHRATCPRQTVNALSSTRGEGGVLQQSKSITTIVFLKERLALRVSNWTQQAFAAERFIGERQSTTLNRTSSTALPQNLTN
jgi:hypothetical protein